MKKKGSSRNRTFIPPQFKYIISIYIAAVLFFAFFRILFQWNFAEQLGSGTSLKAIFESYIIGWRFDQIIILIILAPLLILLPWFSLENKIIQRLSQIYIGVLFSFCFILQFADIRFYSYFNSRLNFLAYEYLADGKLTRDLIYSDQKFWHYIGLWIVLSALFIWLSHYLLKRLTNKMTITSPPIRIVWFLILVVLFASGIRGRFSLAPMDWGIAYFSENHTLNQSALNGIYTLARNYLETSHDPRLSFLNDKERFQFVPKEEALKTVQQYLQQPNMQFIEPDKSIKRTVTAKKNFSFNPNIVIIVMESWSGKRTSCLGAPLNLTPHFDSLAKNGILFTDFYANGTRTNYGLAAVLCSYPALPGRAILKRYDSQHPFISLAQILQNRGYTNIFFYGGDFAFDNMEGFFRQEGYTRFIGEDNFAFSDEFSKWGVPDHILFNAIDKSLDTFPRPFQISVMTLSNHEPFDLPDSSVRRFYDDSPASKKNNSIVYADWAIGQLIKEAKTHPVFDSTIFVFVSDHCLLESSKLSIHPEMFHIPLLIYSPKLLGEEGQIIKTTGGQIDIIPTLMGILGGDYTNESWGRDLLDLPPDDSGFAIINLWDRLAWISQSDYYYEIIGQNRHLYKIIDNEFIEKPIDSANQSITDRIRLFHQFSQLADQMTLPVEKK